MKYATYFYDLATGVFTGRFSLDPDEFAPMVVPPGQGIVRINGSPDGWKIDPTTGDFAPYTPPAPLDTRPSDARALRDALIAASDRTQLPDAPLTPPEVAQWRVWRAAMRNVPQQPGFPAVINWPATPDGSLVLPDPSRFAGPAPVVPPAAPRPQTRVPPTAPIAHPPPPTPPPPLPPAPVQTPGLGA